MNSGKYAYMKYALVKSSGVSNITPVRSKNRRIIISVFLSTFKVATNRFILEKNQPLPSLLNPTKRTQYMTVLTLTVQNIVIVLVCYAVTQIAAGNPITVGTHTSGAQ